MIGKTAMLMLAATMSLASCSRNKSQNEEPVEPQPPTYLRVNNQAFLDMTIYVYRSAQRIRLGQASGGSMTRLLIPASLIFNSTSLRFQADPIGANRQSITQENTVSPGDEVTMIIPPS